MSDGRDEFGRWLPGTAPEGAGRPKSAAIIKELADKAAPEALAVIVELSKTAESESLRFSAACYLVDRSAGKPSQSTSLDISILMQKKLEGLSVEEIRRLRDTVASLEDDMPSATGDSHAPPLIEHDGDM